MATKFDKHILHLKCPKCKRRSIFFFPIPKEKRSMSRPTMIKQCYYIKCDYEEEIPFEQAMEEKYRLST